MAPTADELQDQIYIVAGVLGGVVALLLFFVIFLCCSMFSMKKDVKKAKERDMLEKRGYHEYKGPEIRPIPLTNPLPVPTQPSVKLMRQTSNAHSLANSNVGRGGGATMSGYPKSYENSGYERESIGVKVLPSLNQIDNFNYQQPQIRRANYPSYDPGY